MTEKTLMTVPFSEAEATLWPEGENEIAPRGEVCAGIIRVADWEKRKIHKFIYVKYNIIGKLAILRVRIAKKSWFHCTSKLNLLENVVW